MNILEAIILGIVQGLTEFLPVSSSGHLALLQHLFAIKEPVIFFDTIVHLGTLFAVIFYLRKEIIGILKTLKEKTTIRLVAMIVLGTVPAVIVGLLLKDNIEEIFSSMAWNGWTFIMSAVILFATYFFRNQKKEIEDISWFDSLFIGAFQALAILPAISRSGSTISASMFREMKREDGFKFSFLLSIPAIFGAFLLQFVDQGFYLFNGEATANLVGFLLSVVFGLVSLKIIERVFVKGKLYYFGFYCLALGLLILIFL